mmetsp:Transcript_7746/g.18727  ORF Transcript_7746/g.18727 Transcript_7746/m.18727 type:complete len:289 (-) Transcript_7746:2597-3463(-)
MEREHRANRGGARQEPASGDRALQFPAGTGLREDHERAAETRSADGRRGGGIFDRGHEADEDAHGGPRGFDHQHVPGACARSVHQGRGDQGRAPVQVDSREHAGPARDHRGAVDGLLLQLPDGRRADQFRAVPAAQDSLPLLRLALRRAPHAEGFVFDAGAEPRGPAEDFVLREAGAGILPGKPERPIRAGAEQSGRLRSGAATRGSGPVGTSHPTETRQDGHVTARKQELLPERKTQRVLFRDEFLLPTPNSPHPRMRLRVDDSSCGWRRSTHRGRDWCHFSRTARQ